MRSVSNHLVNSINYTLRGTHLAISRWTFGNVWKPLSHSRVRKVQSKDSDASDAHLKICLHWHQRPAPYSISMSFLLFYSAHRIKKRQWALRSRCKSVKVFHLQNPALPGQAAWERHVGCPAGRPVQEFRSTERFHWPLAKKMFGWPKNMKRF